MSGRKQDPTTEISSLRRGGPVVNHRLREDSFRSLFNVGPVRFGSTRNHDFRATGSQTHDHRPEVP